MLDPTNKPHLIEKLLELATLAHFVTDDASDFVRDHVNVPREHIARMEEILDEFDTLPNPRDGIIRNGPDLVRYYLTEDPDTTFDQD
jgi:hypothetical protein